MVQLRCVSLHYDSKNRITVIYFFNLFFSTAKTNMKCCSRHFWSVNIFGFLFFGLLFYHSFAVEICGIWVCVLSDFVLPQYDLLENNFADKLFHHRTALFNLRWSSGRNCWKYILLVHIRLDLCRKSFSKLVNLMSHLESLDTQYI